MHNAHHWTRAQPNRARAQNCVPDYICLAPASMQPEHGEDDLRPYIIMRPQTIEFLCASLPAEGTLTDAKGSLMIGQRPSPFASGARAVAEHVSEVRAGARVNHLHPRHEGDAAVRHLQHVLRVDRGVEAGPACRLRILLSMTSSQSGPTTRMPSTSPAPQIVPILTIAERASPANFDRSR